MYVCTRNVIISYLLQVQNTHTLTVTGKELKDTVHVIYSIQHRILGPAPLRSPLGGAAVQRGGLVQGDVGVEGGTRNHGGGGVWEVGREGGMNKKRL